MIRDDSSERILLAEDNPLCQKLALAMFQRLGYEADAVNNGLEVLQALERQKYALVLMGIVMPEMDGITATEEVRRRFPKSELPRIIALTAFIHPDIRKKCIEIGMDGYLTKPVRLNELRAVLMKYIEKPESL